MTKKTKRRIAYALIGLSAVALALAVGARLLKGSVLHQLTNGKLEAADYWSRKPAILSAGLGFDNIIGLPQIDEQTVRAAGGSWYGGLTCTNGDEPGDSVLTSSAPAGNIDQAYEGYADYDGGLPVVFSWPVSHRPCADRRQRAPARPAKGSRPS